MAGVRMVECVQRKSVEHSRGEQNQFVQQIELGICFGTKFCAQNCVPPAPPECIHTIAYYSMKSPDGWWKLFWTLKDFWFVEINVWALEMVEKGI